MDIDLDAEELRKKLEEQLRPKEGWSKTTGTSPLRVQLQTVVGLLGEMKGELEKDLEKKVRILKDLQQAEVKNSPHRVKGKSYGHNR